MEFIDEEQTPALSAETVLTAALKLLGIFLLCSAILQSGILMNLLFSISTILSSSSSISGQQWTNLGTTLASTGLAVGFAIILLRHGGRAAHWLSIRSDIDVPFADPTQKWFRGSLVFIGVWVLATRTPIVLTTLAWALVGTTDSSALFGSANSTVFAVIAFFLVLTVPGLGLGLILCAPRLGDWLYAIASGTRNDASTEEAH